MANKSTIIETGLSNQSGLTGKETDLTEGMNLQQKQAVLYDGGPLMVVAGAGSGKTRVLTHRIARFISNGVNPENIVAITFTNKAAREMKERLGKLVGDKTVGIYRDIDGKVYDLPDASLTASTFHSYCVKILRQHANTIGYGNDFTILDEDASFETFVRVTKILAQNGVLEEEYKKQRDCYVIKAAVSYSKNFLEENEILLYEDHEFNMRDAKIIRDLYKEYLLENNAMDFDDLLLNTVKVLRNNNIRDDIASKHTHVFVDEWQDTNTAQYEIIRLITQNHGQVTVVGDEDQSIYAFRGANIENTTKFLQDFGAHKIMLETNYRSTKNILDISNSIIKHNSDRIDKTLKPRVDDYEIPVKIYKTENNYQEAEFITNKIIERLETGQYEYNDIMVLSRTNRQSENVLAQLRFAGVPAQIKGTNKNGFFDSREIKDLVAYIKSIVDPQDSVSVARVALHTKRGISKNTVERAMVYAHQNKQSLFETLQDCYDGIADKSAMGLRTPAYNALALFYEELREYRRYADENYQSAKQTILHILEETNFFDAYPDDDHLQKREHNVDMFLNAAEKEDHQYKLAVLLQQNPDSPTSNLTEKTVVFPETRHPELSNIKTSLENIVDKLVLGQQENEDTQNVVQVMTIHSSKGLEAPVVFITNANQGSLPFFLSQSMEEERRLMYVAMTRAKKELYIASPKKVDTRQGFIPVEESPFLHEFDRTDHILSSTFHAYSADYGMVEEEQMDSYDLEEHYLETKLMYGKTVSQDEDENSVHKEVDGQLAFEIMMEGE